MATVTLIPEYPIPNKPVQVLFSADNASCNFIRVWVTVAPVGSSLDKSIKNTQDQRNRFEVFNGTPGSDFPLNTSFDKGGKYTFVIQEYKKGSGYGGAYQGDPDGGDLEQQLGSEQTVYIFIGQRLTQVIGPAQARSVITLWVWDDTIRTTFKSIHGEDTPSITATPLTDRIKSSIDSSEVKTALANLVGVNCNTAIGALSTYVNDYFDNWNAHAVNTSVHNDPDSFNRLDSSLRSASTSSTLKDFVNKSISLQKMHYLNDNALDFASAMSGTQVGPGLADFHDASDRMHLSLYSSVGSFDEAFGALVDLIRCYEAHRITMGVHSNIDGTNVMSALSPLMLVHKAYLSNIATDNPTPPEAQSAGAQILISAAGFKEV